MDLKYCNLLLYLFPIICTLTVESNARGCSGKFGCPPAAVRRGGKSGASVRKVRGFFNAKSDKFLGKNLFHSNDKAREEPEVDTQSSKEPKEEKKKGGFIGGLVNAANPVNLAKNTLKIPGLLGEVGKQGLVSPLATILEPITGLLNETLVQITKQVDKITTLVNTLSTNLTMSLNGITTGLTAAINNSTMSLTFSIGEVSKDTTHGVVDIGKTVTKETVATVSKITDPKFLTGILTNLIKGLLPILGLLFSSLFLLIGMVFLLFLSCCLFSRYNAAVKENQGIIISGSSKEFQGLGYQKLKRTE